MRRKTIPSIFRQGDVLILATDEIPAAAREVPRDRGRIVLAYGEHTGHAHAILDSGATLLALTDSDVDDRFLEITSRLGVELVHEEHVTVPLPAGEYIVRRQREYSPEAIRTVAD